LFYFTGKFFAKRGDRRPNIIYFGGKLKTVMPGPTYLHAQADGVVLSVKLQPRASANEIGEPLGDELRIKVTAPPVDAAANEALVRLLADTLDCPRGCVEIVRGRTSRHKAIKLHGLTAEEVSRKLH
jgi:uncharacterized protein